MPRLVPPVFDDATRLKLRKGERHRFALEAPSLENVTFVEVVSLEVNERFVRIDDAGPKAAQLPTTSILKVDFIQLINSGLGIDL